MQVEVPVQVVGPATPGPPLSEAVAEFYDVPEDVLLRVREDVKQAVRNDDEAHTLTIRPSAPFGPFMQLLSDGSALPLHMEWMIEQGDWVQFRDPMAEQSPVLKSRMVPGPSGSSTGATARRSQRCGGTTTGAPNRCGRAARAVRLSASAWRTRLCLSGARASRCSRLAMSIELTSPGNTSRPSIRSWRRTVSTRRRSVRPSTQTASFASIRDYRR